MEDQFPHICTEDTTCYIPENMPGQSTAGQHRWGDDMANTECAPRDHQMLPTFGGTPADQVVTTKCRICGVGDRVRIRKVADRKYHVSLEAFPARGSQVVSNVMGSVFADALNSTCRKIEADGNTVVRGQLKIPTAEASRSRPQQDGRGCAWLLGLLAIAVITVVVIIGIRFLGGSDTPSGVVASAINDYRIKVSWADSSKDVTGYHIDNGCPAGTCGGHGITLAKTTGQVTSTIFRVTPGTYQCFRVQAITKSTLSSWSGYGCASTPGITISGTRAWTRTHVILKSGDRLEIKAAGQISIGSFSPKSPTGKPACRPATNYAVASLDFPAPHLPCLSLIARIGHHQPFEVGTSAVIITPPGRLYLGVNASNFSDSSGSWTVNIKIGGPPPAP
jgi:hypothetical protein